MCINERSLEFDMLLVLPIREFLSSVLYRFAIQAFTIATLSFASIERKKKKHGEKGMIVGQGPKRQCADY